MEPTKTLLIRAAESHFLSLGDKALATLEIYLRNPVAIGEHPQIVDEIVKAVEDLTHARDCITTLKDVTNTAFYHNE